LGADGTPLFLQLVEAIEAAILDGSLREGDRAPSTNELAAFHRVNPATAARALTHLATDGTLYKQRGIGMFVTTGALARLQERRRASFVGAYLTPMIDEARALGIDGTELRSMLDEHWNGT
jgi:GntR family transcriptional regulator